MKRDGESRRIILVKVKARLKTLDEMPEWARCCDAQQRIIADKAGIILVVDTKNTFIANNVTCPQCRSVARENVKYITVTDWPECVPLMGSPTVPMEFFEFDEGQTID
jgi:hypothetical protein